MESPASQTLFGHLAVRFTAHPENLATESLDFILQRSATARRAFIAFLGHGRAKLPDSLTFRTQEGGEDNAIPDLVGLGSDGKQCVIVEAKFWAGLTDAQPVTYLSRLREQGGSLLLFVAPAKRFATLWPELVRRTVASGVTLSENPVVTGEFLSAVVDGNRLLALASWRSVLSALRSAVEAEREMSAASDLAQLAGLCERMDDDAFWPLRSEELACEIGRRTVQFCNLVDEVTDRAVAQGWASTEKLRAAASSGWYGRYMTIHGYCSRLAVDANLWGRWRATPIWLGVSGKSWEGWTFWPEMRERLARLELERNRPAEPSYAERSGRGRMAG
jgi:hypothetical protein